jgi:hypothetical protein
MAESTPANNVTTAPTTAAPLAYATRIVASNAAMVSLILVNNAMTV